MHFENNLFVYCLLQLKKTENDMHLYSGCDTTFNLGYFYLTPLVFHHTVFDKDPVIAVAFMMHERILQSVHDFGNIYCKNY